MVAEQLALTGLRLRSGAFLLVMVFVVVASAGARLAWSIAHRQQEPGQVTNLSYVPEMTVVLVVVALIVPLIIWQDEEPPRRAYHSAMPFPQAAHAVARTVAGLVWLMLVIVAFLLGTVAMRAMMQYVTGDPQLYVPGFAWWEWLIPFTSLTIAYLLASAAAIGTRRPFVWIFGGPLIYLGVATLLSGANLGQQARSLLRLATGYYGLNAAIAGSIQWGDATGHVYYASLDRWLGATTMWAAAAGVLFWLVARRRYETT